MIGLKNYRYYKIINILLTYRFKDFVVYVLYCLFYYCCLTLLTKEIYSFARRIYIVGDFIKGIGFKTF